MDFAARIVLLQRSAAPGGPAIALCSPMKNLRLLLSALACVAVASAQSADTPYGAPIGLEAARKVLAAAQAEAQKNNWKVAIAIVDSGGHLVSFERMDTTQYGSVDVAIEKARTSSGFRRPSKAFQDMVASGGEGLRLLTLTGAMPIEGGVPIIVGGRIVGAIGVSGVTSAQDGQIARAGAAAVAQR
jgi:glc operon protein GlcG